LSEAGAVVEVDARTDFEAPSLTQEIWKTCLSFLLHSNPKIQAAAIRVCESLSRGHQHFQAELLSELEKQSGTYIKPVLFQCTLTAGNLPMPQALPFMAQVASDHCNEWLIREALMTGLQDWEMTFLQILLNRSDWKESSPGRVLMLQALAKAVTTEGDHSGYGLFLAAVDSQVPGQHWRAESLLRGALEQLQFGDDDLIAFSHKPSVWESLKNHESLVVRELMSNLEDYVIWPGHPLFSSKQKKELEREFTDQETRSLELGKTLYQQICAGCHGAKGEGLKAQAPPLLRSEWVKGSSARLIRIVLQGMQGPLNVAGKRYTTPEILAEMPPLSVLEDSQLSSILNYIRSEWGDPCRMDHA
jgi:mono/diheme cytochrome c family protein